MATRTPTRPGSELEITPDDERIINERLKTYEQDKKDTVDARESIEQMIRERRRKRMPQPH